MNTISKLLAILRRDALTALRQRRGFAFTIVSLMAQLAAFYFLARAIGPAFRPGGVEYFPYLVVGTGLYTFFVMSTQAFLRTVQEAQQTGTMEVLMTTSTAPAELILLSAVSSFAGNLVGFVFYLLAGAAVFRASIHMDLLSFLAVMTLCIAISIAFGLGTAALQVAYQKGSASIWLFGSVIWLVSGSMFPVETLPRSLQIFARLIPINAAVEGMRGAVLRAEPLHAMTNNLANLFVFSVVLLPAGLWALSFSLKRARINGTLSFY